MPKVFEIEGFRGYFFSNEGSPLEPVHIHIAKGHGEAKFWVTPFVFLDEARNLKVSELARAEEIVNEHQDEIIRKWNRHFNKPL